MTEQKEYAEKANDVIDEVVGCPYCAKRKRWRVKMKSLIVNVILCLLVLLLALAFVIPQFADYTTRTRVAEGLVLASAAKNLVADNAVNGFPLNTGWEPLSPTKNTQSIMIDEITGVIFIVSNPKSTEGGVVLTLIPTVEGERLVPGKIPQGIIYWECKALSLGSLTMSHIPSECRTLMTSTL